MDYKEPLFWIHLNMDYPFNLKGILYFPKINTEYDSIEGTIKLYNSQVFIADNIKEVIPAFLMLLKGVIDCPDLPLNVSRSALQNDGFVKKIADYITKKVADKLSGMCKTDRESYEKYWDDISPFIKYGCLKDEKFSERMMEYILYKDLDGKYLTLEEYLEAQKASSEKTEEKAEIADTSVDSAQGSADENTAGEETLDLDEEEDAGKADGSEEKTEEKTEENPEEKKSTTIYYVTDETQQSQYINMFRETKQNAVILKHNIDSAFITHVERAREDLKFLRIDADVTESTREETSEDELKEASETLKELFKKVLNNDKLEVRVEKLKNTALSSVLTLTEESRRMQEMMRMYNMYGMDPSMFAPAQTLVLNANNELVKYILAHKDGEHTDLFCRQLYDLALIANQPLQPEAMTQFINRSNEIMMLLAQQKD